MPRYLNSPSSAIDSSRLNYLQSPTTSFVMVSRRRDRPNSAFLPLTPVSSSPWRRSAHRSITPQRPVLRRAAALRMASDDTPLFTTPASASQTSQAEISGTPTEVPTEVPEEAELEPKIEKRLPPEPDMPSETVDTTLGEETAVITAGDEEDATVTKHDSTWLESVLAARPAMSVDHPLAPLRADADSVIPDLPVPGRRMESYRFTDLRSLYVSRYIPGTIGDDEDLSQFDLRRYAPDTAGVVLVFVDGVFNEKLSIVNDDSAMAWMEAGGYCGSAANYSGDAQELCDVLSAVELGDGKGRKEEGGLFPSLAHAIASDAAVLYIPNNYAVSRPVAVVFVSTPGVDKQRAKACATRLAVIARRGSKISLLESHVSLDTSSSYDLTLSATGCLIGDNASVKHYFVNDTCEEAHLLSHVHANVLRDGRYEFRGLGLGSKVGRTMVGIDLDGAGAHGLVHGSLVADGYQILDIHSRICHNALKTTSSQLQKNISADHGRSVFKGKIVVTKNGDGTDSEQLCRSLLLSDKATVDAMPVLEIATDDVKCSHGATVADLEDDELFYCQSRGISYSDAQFLLISGFAGEALGDCPYPTVSEQVARKVDSVAAKSLKRSRDNRFFTSL